jgi:hypothetical protein
MSPIQALHFTQHLVGAVAGEAEVDIAHAHVAQGAQVAGDVGRLAREQAALAVARRSRQLVAELAGAQHQPDLATGRRRHLLQPLALDLVALEAVHRVGGVGADRVPRVAERRGAAHGGRALAAHPDRRMRLLHGLRTKGDVVEPAVGAVELRPLLAPQFLPGGDILVGHPAAFLEGRRVDRLELLLEPARADADGEAAVRQVIDGRQHLGGEHRRPVRHHHDRRDEAELRRPGGHEGHRGQLVVALAPRRVGELAGRAVGVTRMDVVGNDDVIAEGGVVEAQRLAALGDPEQVVGRRERSGGRRVEADAHVVSPFGSLAKSSAGTSRESAHSRRADRYARGRRPRGRQRRRRPARARAAPPAPSPAETSSPAPRARCAPEDL